MSEYQRATKRVEVSVGQSVRIMRELQEISQNELALALRCHPAVLVFPGWDADRHSAA